MSRKIVFAALTILSLLYFSTLDCLAQRHVPGQNVVNVDFYTWKQFGGSLSWGKSGFKGHSLWGVNYASGAEEPCRVLATKETEEMTYMVKSHDWYASGGYFFRVLSNRSRSVNLMLGGTVDLGARVHGDITGMDGVPKAKFIYGVSPIAKFEYFPGKSMSINAHFRPRFQLYGHKVFEKVFYPQFGIGCTIYIL